MGGHCPFALEARTFFHCRAGVMVASHYPTDAHCGPTLRQRPHWELEWGSLVIVIRGPSSHPHSKKDILKLTLNPLEIIYDRKENLP